MRTGGGLNGYGDPSLLVDVETGRIFMFHAAGTRAGFFEAVAGLEPDDDVQHCDLSFSDDDGLTWQHRRITAQLKLRPPGHAAGPSPAITGIFAAAGQGIQVHTGPYRGRLVQQFVVLAGGEIMAASAFSDDHGENWTLGELIGARTHGFSPNENKVAALQDGRLLLHSRGTPRRLAAISDDGGATWSALRPVEDLPDPGDNGSLVRFDGLPSLASFAGRRHRRLAAGHQQPRHGAAAEHGAQPVHRQRAQLAGEAGPVPGKLGVFDGGAASRRQYRRPVRAPGVPGNRVCLGARRGSSPHSSPAALLPGPRAARSSLRSAPESDGGAGGRPGPGDAGLVFDMELRSITPGRPPVWQNAGEFHVMPAGGERLGRPHMEGNRPGLLGRGGAGDRHPGGAGPELRPDHSRLQGRGHPRLHRQGTQRRIDAGDRGPAVRARLGGLPRGGSWPRRGGPLFHTRRTPSPEADVARGYADVAFEVAAERGGTAERRRRAFTFDTGTGDVTCARN